MNELEEIKKKVDYLYEQQAKKDEFGPNHIFSLKEIESMTPEQFDRHWPEIKRQMDKGQIE